jgi:uncharacterized protein YlxP (DUF503 family)
LFVGTVEFDLYLPGIASLKEKRRKLKPLLSRLQSRFNISAAEVGYNDNLQMAQIGIAVVCNDKKFADQVIAKVVESVRNEPEINMSDYRVEIF